MGTAEAAGYLWCAPWSPCQKAEGTQPAPRASCGSVRASDGPSSIIFGGQHPLRPRACLPLSPSSAETQGIWVRRLKNFELSLCVPGGAYAAAQREQLQNGNTKFRKQIPLSPRWEAERRRLMQALFVSLLPAEGGCRRRWFLKVAPLGYVK